MNEAVKEILKKLEESTKGMSDAKRMVYAALNRNNKSIDESYLMETEVIEMPFSEMATVGRLESPKGNFLVVATPDTGRNDSYFKVCNHLTYTKATHVIRLAFTEVEYYEHKGDGKELWEMSSRDIKRLIEWLESNGKAKIEYGSVIFDTNWKQAIYHWNNECGFFNHKDYDERFPEGCAPGSQLSKNPQFVPLNQKMPDYTKLQF
jgi:hypothetical protein